MPTSTTPEPSLLGIYRSKNRGSFAFREDDHPVVTAVKDHLARSNPHQKWSEAAARADYLAPYAPIRAANIRSCGWDGTVSVGASGASLSPWRCHDPTVCPSCGSYVDYLRHASVASGAATLFRQGIPAWFGTICPGTKGKSAEEAVEEVKRVCNALNRAYIKPRRGHWVAAVIGIEVLSHDRLDHNAHLHFVAFGVAISEKDVWGLLWPRQPYNPSVFNKVEIRQIEPGDEAGLDRRLAYTCKCGFRPGECEATALTAWAEAVATCARTRCFRRWRIGFPIKGQSNRVANGAGATDFGDRRDGVSLSFLITRANHGDAAAVDRLDALLAASRSAQTPDPGRRKALF